MIRCSAMLRALVLLTPLVLLTACSNEANTELHFGSVSVGQQLIDLEAARKAGAISDTEFQDAKSSILRVVEEVADSIDD